MYFYAISVKYLFGRFRGSMGEGDKCVSCKQGIRTLLFLKAFFCYFLIFLMKSRIECVCGLCLGDLCSFCCRQSEQAILFQ